MNEILGSYYEIHPSVKTFSINRNFFFQRLPQISIIEDDEI